MRVLVQVSYGVEAGMETRYAAKLTPSPLEGEGGLQCFTLTQPLPSRESINLLLSPFKRRLGVNPRRVQCRHP